MSLEGLREKKLEFVVQDGLVRSLLLIDQTTPFLFLQSLSAEARMHNLKYCLLSQTDRCGFLRASPV